LDQRVRRSRLNCEAERRTLALGYLHVR
jgi:hypothetical protein